MSRISHLARQQLRSLGGQASRIVGLGAIITSSFCFLASPVLALSVSPAIVDVSVDPGKTETQSLTITNDERTSQTYFVTIQKFLPKGERGQQEFLPPSDTEGLPEWMYVDKAEVTLEPGQSTRLQVAIRVPSDARAGGHYAALFLTKRQPTGEQVAMLPRLGILFFVHVSGQMVEKLRVVDVSLDQVGLYSGLPVGFRVTIQNEGMTDETPKANVTIKNVFGMTSASFETSLDRVLPSSRRTSLIIWGDGFALGPYTATISFSGKGFDGTVERTLTFSVWPWSLLMIGPGVLFALIVGFFILKKIIIKNATAAPRT